MMSACNIQNRNTYFKMESYLGPDVLCTVLASFLRKDIVAKEGDQKIFSQLFPEMVGFPRGEGVWIGTVFPRVLKNKGRFY